jgi:predicted RNase H-like nuclease (RuvC/YqgF family)
MTDERVDRLEEALQAFVRDVGVEFNKLYNAQIRGEAETQALREEMKAFKDEMAAFKDEMADFKDEMADFKKEMSDYKEEARAQNRQMNRRWAEIADKMGTLAEDIVAPNLPRVAREMFACEAVDLFTVRMRKRWDGETREYDVIVACGDYVLVNETKSTLKSAHVDQMIGVLGEFRKVFPEYRDKRLIGVLASLYVDQSVVRRASSKGILVMGMGENTMEVLNKEAVRPY